MEDEFAHFLSELADWDQRKTTAALQKLPLPPAHGQQLWADADRAPEQPETKEAALQPQLHKFSSLESLAFANLLAAGEEQVCEGVLFPWELTATASAMVSLPGTMPAVKQEPPASALKAACGPQPWPQPADATPHSKLAAMVPVASPALHDFDLNGGTSPSPIRPSQEPAFARGGRQRPLRLASQRCLGVQLAWADTDADGDAANPRASKRRAGRPKWQAAYESADEASDSGSPEPAPKRPAPAPAPASPQPRRAGRKRLQVDHITLESLQQQGLFDVPIQTAAQELGVGLSVLKRICRQIGLARWPFRTRQSLRGVIAKTEQYLAGDDSAETHKAAVVEVLEQTLNGLQGEAGQRLSESVRRYRQSVFKLNYKIKKGGRGAAGRAAGGGGAPSIPSTAAAKMAAASERLKADHEQAASDC